MELNFCYCCQKTTVHNKYQDIWEGNLKKIIVYLICIECNCQSGMWLENKEETNGYSLR